MPLTKGEEPVTGFSFDLSNPRSALMTMVSAVIGMVGLLYLFNFASNRGLPFVNSLLSGLSPALDSSGGSGTVFD
jgi:hypothetical protein